MSANSAKFLNCELCVFQLSVLCVKILSFFENWKFIAFVKSCEETTPSAKAATPSVEGELKKQAKIVKYREVFGEKRE